MATLADIEVLRHVPPFVGLAERHLHAIADRCRQAALRPGTLVTKSGVVPDALHVVLRGRLRVVDERTPGAAIPIDDLGRGAHAGESVLDGSTAPFSVYCVTDVETLQLDEPEVRSLLQAWPDIEEALRGRLERRQSLAPAEHDPLSPDPESLEPASSTPQVAAEPDQQLAVLDEGTIEWKKPLAVPPSTTRRPAMVRQAQPVDAGPACLASIARCYGRRISLGTARDAAGGSSQTGLAVLARASERLGFECVTGLATIDHLSRNLLPAVAGLSDGRWVVVYRVSRASVYVGDPAAGATRMSRAEFLDTWSGETLYLRPTDRFLETRESPLAYSRFVGYFRPLRVLLLEVALASLLVQVLNLLLPVFARFVIDDVIGRRDGAWLAPAIFGMCGAVALAGAAGFSRQYLLRYVSRQVDARLTGDVHRHLLSLPMRFFEGRHVSDTVGHFEAAGRITAFLTGTGVGFVIDALTAGLAAALMFYYDPRLAAVAVFFVLLEVVQLYFVTPRLNRGSRELSRRAVDTESLLLESFSGLATIKVLAIEHYTRWKLESRLVSQINASFQTLRHRALAVLGSQVVGYLGPVGVLFYGAVLALRGEITVGVLVAFVLLSRLLAAPFGTLVAVWGHFQDALAAVDAVNDMLDTPPESAPQPGDAVTLQRLHGHIRFDGVSFRYDDDGPEILSDVTFECYGGQRVAIVGPSGSGKSTLIKLLLGFYSPTSGGIHVDGFDLSGIWLPSFRRQAGVVLQEPRLFRGAIRANITQTMPTAPLTEAVAAARMANAHGFVSRLAHGYETMLEENGANVSGGQRQQIAIARALLHRPRMLILDEATSNLDEESERMVQQSLDTHFRDCTVFTITQRLGSVRQADLVLVLDRGRIVEQGHPDQLLAQHGLFYRLTLEQDAVRGHAS